jgi:putative spermidine/putrescine transport system substrate-binding protein
MVLISCSGQEEKKQIVEEPLSWEETLTAAKGQTVHMMMWKGDPFINQYMDQYVVPQLKEQFDIDLDIASGQGTAIVGALMTEIEAGKDESSLDMVWINGETFFQLRQIDALYGPFTSSLPNAQYIDFENPFIGIDFQQPIDGYECPWGNVQLALIYDTLRTPKPPRTMEALTAYAKTHPGKITIPTEFTGMTLLKSMLIALAGGGDALSGPFDQVKYDQYAPQLWEYLQDIKPFLWKKGETFPSSLSQMHQMFANGEIDLTMSNNDGEVDNKIALGTFANSARAYVLESGTIQNSHYLGIINNSPSKAAAKVAINFMISPEAQIKKFDPSVWGDGTVLDIKRLPSEWQNRFTSIPTRKYAPKRADIQRLALQELAPEYMINLYEDFRKEVIE